MFEGVVDGVEVVRGAHVRKVLALLREGGDVTLRCAVSAGPAPLGLLDVGALSGPRRPSVPFCPLLPYLFPHLFLPVLL